MLFGLFAPRPPLNVREKLWTEIRMRWLARQFGVDRLLKTQVLVPDDWRLPEHYEGTHDDTRRLLDCVCGIMQVAPSSIRLEVCEDEAMPGAAGLYEPGLIRIAEGQLADPPGLVAVLAHELAHDLLIGRGLLKDDLDSEWVTDLLPVSLGLGIFTASQCGCLASASAAWTTREMFRACSSTARSGPSRAVSMWWPTRSRSGSGPGPCGGEVASGAKALGRLGRPASQSDNADPKAKKSPPTYPPT